MRVRISIFAAMLLIGGVLLATGCSSVPGAVSAAQPDGANAASANAAAAKMPFAETVKAKAPAVTTVAAGTLLEVRLQQTVSSATANDGDNFAAVLDEPLVAEGRTIAPRGAAVTGRVISARRSGRIHNSGYLRLALTSIQVNGRALPIHSSSIFVMGAAHKKRNLTLIGGGAGMGALIGAIAGGGKGALIGSAVGAGAGTAGAYATGKKDVSFAAERHLTFRLTQPLTVE